MFKVLLFKTLDVDAKWFKLVFYLVRHLVMVGGGGGGGGTNLGY